MTTPIDNTADVAVKNISPDTLSGSHIEDAFFEYGNAQPDNTADLPDVGRDVGPDGLGLAEMPVSLSFGVDGYSSVKRLDMTWGELLSAMTEHTLYALVDDKKTLPIHAPCVLRDYAVPPPIGDKKPKNLTDANVAQITVLVFDVDNADQEAMQSPLQAVEFLEEHGIAHAYHSSWSSTDQRPKYRIVIAITAPIELKSDDDRKAYKLAYERAMQLLGIQGDTACSNASRYYIAPAAPMPERMVVDGKMAVKGDRVIFGPYEDGKARFGDWKPGKAFDFAAIFERAREEIAARASKSKTATAPPPSTSQPTKTPVTQANLKTPGLFEFNAKYRLDFKIEAFVEHYEPDGIRGPGANGGIHCRCPNQYGEISGRPHTDASDTSTAFWVRNPEDGKGYVIKCHTAGCTEHFGGDALRLLDALCFNHGITDVSALIPFSEGAQRDAQARDERLIRHQEAWQAAEQLAADEASLDKAVKAFKKKPSDGALKAILKALATLAGC